MTDKPPANSPNLIAEEAMRRHVDAIRRITVEHDYAYDCDRLLQEKLSTMAECCEMVLDIGQSTREKRNLFQADRLVTMDINHSDPPPDIIDDICSPQRVMANRYDGIVCLSVLEHVYDPFAAIDSIHRLLRPGGCLLLHLPFLYRYHAPADLKFTDAYRFSRDGIAWLLRDFNQVTLYSIRGPYSSIYNLHKFWKKRVEKHCGMAPSRWLDKIGLRFFRRPNSDLQVSGYYAWALK